MTGVDAVAVAPEAGRLARKAASRDPELVTRTKENMAPLAAVDDPVAAIELELAAQRRSMERPPFLNSRRDGRERLGRGSTAR